MKPLFSKRCAVTAFDNTIKLHKDGRERGLWVFLEDEGTAHFEYRSTIFNEALEEFKKALVRDGITTKAKLKANDRKLYSAVRESFEYFIKFREESQAALMEWPDALKFYNAMGKEIEKARARGDLPKPKRRKP